jgi:hypothetical protein
MNIWAIVGILLPWMVTIFGVLMGTLVIKIRDSVVFFLVFYVMAKIFATSNIILLPV